MIDPNKVTEAVMEFMQNPTWKDIFTNAPGGAMERLAISFYFSKFHDQFQPEDFQEYRDLRDEYEKSMTEEDLQYLIDNSDKPNAKKHYEELLAKVQGGQQPQGNMRFEKDEPSQTEGQGEEQTESPAEGEEQQPTAEAPVEPQGEPQESGDAETPPEEEKLSEGQETAPEPNPESEPTEKTEDGGEEEPQKDEKYETALSVALEYLQNEKKNK